MTSDNGTADAPLFEPTRHRILPGDARNLTFLADQTVSLVVTSPPYPMIEMWDEIFAQLDPAVGRALESENAGVAFDLMHAVLDEAWREAHRVLIDGGILCVNIGDATRTVAGRFQLHGNAARVLDVCRRIGFDALPRILWRKSTNAPNKFMGSGMLPAGAYVTLEHEHILIFRKGGKRAFESDEARALRRRSAYFWEERNRWFSDIWTDLPGERQATTGATRKRSGAFPLELPYRLISMYSVLGDLVLDPFAGTGSTNLAAVGCARSSIGVEVDEGFAAAAKDRVISEWRDLNARSAARFDEHRRFLDAYRARGKEARHVNVGGFPVVTAQETALLVPTATSVEATRDDLEATHAPLRWEYLL